MFRMVANGTLPGRKCAKIKSQHFMVSLNFLICNKHLLVFLAPNIIFIGQMERDIGRSVSRVQYLSTADQ